MKIGKAETKSSGAITIVAREKGLAATVNAAVASYLVNIDKY